MLRAVLKGSGSSVLRICLIFNLKLLALTVTAPLMDLEQNFRSRAETFGIDETLCRHVRAIGHALVPRLEALFADYFQALSQRAGYEGLTPKIRDEVVALETRHFAALLQRVFDATYVVRLKTTVDGLQTAGFSGRTHGLAAAWLAKEAAGYLRNQLYVSRRAIDRLDGLGRVLHVDAANFTIFEQTYHQDALDHRGQAISQGLLRFSSGMNDLTCELHEANADLNNAAAVVKTCMDASNRSIESVLDNRNKAVEVLRCAQTSIVELAASISEITHFALSSDKVLKTTVAAVSSAHGKIGSLAAMVTQIDSVTKLIANIASRTNLLALNATIEAARAGERGRGFAIVAAEVKALAGQTAHATAEINACIGSVQQASLEAVMQMDNVGDRVSELAEAASSIAVAVSQQNAATQTIAETVHKAVSHAGEVNAAISVLRARMADTVDQAQGLDASHHLLQRISTDLASRLETLAEELKASATVERLFKHGTVTASSDRRAAESGILLPAVRKA